MRDYKIRINSVRGYLLRLNTMRSHPNYREYVGVVFISIIFFIFRVASIFGIVFVVEVFFNLGVAFIFRIIFIFEAVLIFEVVYNIIQYIPGISQICSRYIPTSKQLYSSGIRYILGISTVYLRKIRVGYISSISQAYLRHI